MPDDSSIPRRGFLTGALGAGSLFVIGCGGDSSGGNDATPLPSISAMPDITPSPTPQSCANPFEGGEFLGLIDFDEDPVSLNRKSGQGWDGRLRTDLSEVDRGNEVVPNDRFYIRTFEPDLIDRTQPWTIRLGGLIAAPLDIGIEELRAAEQDMGVHVLECSGNTHHSRFGLLSAGQWSGVPIADLLSRATANPEAVAVRVSGFDEHSVPSTHSTPGASWIFTFDQLQQAGAFLATRMNGEALPADHGDPVRLYVPGWYGCTCIKWVNAIDWVDADAPATPQMEEFATRTHQPPFISLASEFQPATMHQAAMPVRVERWNVGGNTMLRIVGILWGGTQTTDALTIRFGNDPAVPVDVCPPMTQNRTWTLWEHAWTPPGPGNYRIHCDIDDPAIETRRLDTGHYDRGIVIT